MTNRKNLRGIIDAWEQLRGENRQLKTIVNNALNYIHQLNFKSNCVVWAFAMSGIPTD